MSLLDYLKSHGPARPTDPQTSHDAGRSVSRSAGQQEVLDILRAHGPLADFEIRGLASASLSDSRVRTARSELVRHGLVRRADIDRRTPTGRRCQVWEATR